MSSNGNSGQQIQLSAGEGETIKLTGSMVLSEANALLASGSSALAASASSNAAAAAATEFDLAAVTAVDSSALAVIFGWQRRARELGKSLRIIHPPKDLLSLAELYGVTELLPLGDGQVRH